MYTDKLSRKELRALTPEAKAEYQKAQQKIRNKRNYKDNKDRIKAAHKAYNDANRSKLNARSKAYYKSNKEAIKIKAKKYRVDNVDKIAAIRKTHRDVNRDAINAKQNAKYYESITNYVVYSHTNEVGDTYIGSGIPRRPYALSTSNRTAEWHKVFTKDNVTIEVLHTFDTRTEARAKESEIIKEIGIENLINVRRDR